MVFQHSQESRARSGVVVIGINSSANPARFLEMKAKALSGGASQCPVSPASIPKGMVYGDESLRDGLLKGLRKAGLPE